MQASSPLCKCTPSTCLESSEETDKKRPRPKSERKTALVWHDETNKLSKKKKRASAEIDRQTIKPMQALTDSSDPFFPGLLTQTNVFVIESSPARFRMLSAKEAGDMYQFVINSLAQISKTARMNRNREIPRPTFTTQPIEELVDNFWQAALLDPLLPSSYLLDNQL